jgi:hypothetical protein
MKKEPYMCISCGYNTPKKSHMVFHLYKLKKQCPGTVNNIELTDEIKDEIIKNRVYHMPTKTPQQIIINTINYNNTINNLITNMDTVDKLTKFINCNNNELIDLDTKLYDKYTKNILCLEQNKPNQDISKNDILNMVCQICELVDDNFIDFNIIYDEKFDRIKMYDSSGVWEESILNVGIKNLLLKIQEYYFDAYERYLIRKIRTGPINGPRQSIMIEHLEEYYRFIGCFDIDPFVKNDINDTEILYRTDEDGYDCCAEQNDDNMKLVYEFRNKYIKIRDNTTKSVINETKKEVINIIKNVSKKNIIIESE